MGWANDSQVIGPLPQAKVNDMARAQSLGETLRAKKDYLYVLPGALMIIVFFTSSIVFTMRLSFFSWNGFGEQAYVGLANYAKLFQDANFQLSLLNTLIWVVVSLIISLALPLVLAILIVNSSRASIFKNIFYFPSTLSGTIGSLIMVAMLSVYGLPRILGLIGLPGLVKDWLAVPYANTFVMIFMGTWQGIGMSMLLFIAGLRNIDRSQIESAQLDGAGGLSLYAKIILPALKPTTIVVLLMSLVNNLKVFDIIWVMTKGGPYRSSETLALTMYTESFIRHDFGGGAAVAVILTVIVTVVAYFSLRSTFRASEN